MDIAGLLLLNGANIDAVDIFGNTPLHYAANLNKKNTIRFLLHLNANPLIKANNRKSAENMTNDKLIKFSIKNGSYVRILHYIIGLHYE